jgi:hypothetical protein
MSGKHEPPTNRSFYLSVATSTLRFAIIVALVVGGIFVISRAFPEPAPGGPGGGGTSSESPTPSTSPTKPPKQEPSPQIAGVVLGVYNGTDVTGLAGETAIKLENKYGYDVPTEPGHVGDTPTKPVAVTTLFYRTDQDKVEAQALADGFFKGLNVQIQKLESGANIPKDVQVAIYLGNDYAATVK